MLIKTVAKIITIALLAGSAESVLAENQSNKNAKKPAVSIANQGKPAVTHSVPATVDKDFIDTGTLEGADVLEGNLEIRGLLVDETVTKFGHQLFDVFNRAWKPIEGASYNIIFGERIDPIRGSLISVTLNDTVIFEGFMAPREEAINELGKGLAKDIRSLVRNTANLEDEELY